MVYKRKSFKRRTRRYAPRRPGDNWFNSGYKTVSKYTNWSAINTALQDIWKLKGLINSEKYKLDIADSGTVILNNGTYSQHLTAVAIGDGDNQRTGNSIYVRSVNIKGSCIFNTAGGAANQFMRLMLIEDTQQISDTVPTLATVLQTTGTGNSYNSHLNTATVGRFKILYNKVYELDSVKAPARNFEINLPMRHHVRYNGTASTDVQRGGLYLMAIADSTADGPTLIYQSRTSYHDN